MCKTLNKILSLVDNENVNKIGIIMHDNADGDAVGSAVALEEAMKQMGKEVDIILQNKIYTAYAMLIGKNRVNKVFVPDEQYDLLFVLDSSEPARIQTDINVLSNTIVVIDHHLGFEKYGTVYWCEGVVATAVLVFKLLQKLPIKINEVMATALYAGLCSD